jgi:hypothetical protein
MGRGLRMDKRGRRGKRMENGGEEMRGWSGGEEGGSPKCLEERRKGRPSGGEQEEEERMDERRGGGGICGGEGGSGGSWWPTISNFGSGKVSSGAPETSFLYENVST